MRHVLLTLGTLAAMLISAANAADTQEPRDERPAAASPEAPQGEPGAQEREKPTGTMNGERSHRRPGFAGPPGRGSGPGTLPAEMDREEILRQFDKDGDGRLSDEERAAMTDAQREFLQKVRHRRGHRAPSSTEAAGTVRKGPPEGAAGRSSREDFIARFDKDGDGVLNEEERAAAQRAREQLIARFDKDGDGRLSEEEKKAAFEEIRREHEEFEKLLLSRFDKDGDGVLNASERAAYDRMRRELIARFDKNGDGRLDEEERAAMRRAMHESERHSKGRR